MHGVYKSKLKQWLKGRRSFGYSRPFSSERRFYESKFARIVGPIDEISIKRIHIKEKIRGHFFLSICLRSQWFITPSVVLILFETINVPMIVDASCRFLLLFLSGSSQESMLWRTLRWFVYRFRYFLVNILYFWKRGHVVIAFPCVVASWFRQNFDQIESIFVLIFL